MYKWKPGSHLSTLDAQECGDTLELLRQHHNGRLTAQIVVEQAIDEQSPLHPAFEWDDTKAAEEYRLEQARSLIRSVLIVSEGTAPEVRAFVTVLQADDQYLSYTHIVQAMENPILREQVLTRAKSELVNWEERYHHLEEFSMVHHVIAKVVSGY